MCANFGHGLSQNITKCCCCAEEVRCLRAETQRYIKAITNNNHYRVPGEIKRREVELDPQASPEEIMSREMELDPQVSPEEITMSREVELDPQVSPEEIMSREVELGCESWTSFASGGSSTAVQRT